MKSNVKLSTRDRILMDEERGSILAMRIDRMINRGEESLALFNGRPRTICALPDTEVELLSANRNATRNLADPFGTASETELDKAFANWGGLANEDRFTASYFSTPLTAYTVGWQDPENLEALVDFVCPKVSTTRRFEYKLAVNKEAFFSEIDDERAIGSEFKRVEYRGLSAYNKTINRGLKYRIDTDEEGAGIINEQLIVSRLLQRCRRNQWRRAAAAAIALGTANVTVNKVWTNTGQSPAPQPAEDIRSLIQGAQAVSGVFPNRVLMDLLSWNLIKKSYAPQLTAGAIAMYNMTVDDFVADQQIDGCMVAKAIYTSLEGNQQNTTGTKAYIAPQQVLAFYGQDNPGLDDPSNFKRFVTAAGDGDFRVYRQQVNSKFVDISVEYYDNILTTATPGAQMLTPS